MQATAAPISHRRAIVRRYAVERSNAALPVAAWHFTPVGGFFVGITKKPPPKRRKGLL
jgi:hypothetical protein